LSNEFRVTVFAFFVMSDAICSLFDYSFFVRLLL
jgi:hypothetical protein